jgi:hypothetical protein
MNPPLKTTGLFLTPRGPYGRRLPERARKHLRASEDINSQPVPKNMQGLAGQMAPNDLGGDHSYRDGRDMSQVWKMPHKVSQDTPKYTPPPESPQPAGHSSESESRKILYPPIANNVMRNAESNGGFANFAPEKKGLLRRFVSHFDGSYGYEGSHPGTDERPGVSGILRYSTNPNVRGEVPNYGPPEKGASDKERREREEHLRMREEKQAEMPPPMLLSRHLPQLSPNGVEMTPANSYPQFRQPNRR